VRFGLGVAAGPGGRVTRDFDGLGAGRWLAGALDGRELRGDGVSALRRDGDGDGRVGDGVTGAGRDGAGRDGAGRDGPTAGGT
jgi:hypothetical protein